MKHFNNLSLRLSVRMCSVCVCLYLERKIHSFPVSPFNSIMFLYNMAVYKTRWMWYSLYFLTDISKNSPVHFKSIKKYIRSSSYINFFVVVSLVPLPFGFGFGSDLSSQIIYFTLWWDYYDYTVSIKMKKIYIKLHFLLLSLWWKSVGVRVRTKKTYKIV